MITNPLEIGNRKRAAGTAPLCYEEVITVSFCRYIASSPVSPVLIFITSETS